LRTESQVTRQGLNSPVARAQKTCRRCSAISRCLLARLDDELRRIGDVALIIIGPITAYLGKVASHHNAELRALLAPLADLAAKHGAAVLAVNHLRKSVGGDAVCRSSASSPSQRRHATSASSSATGRTRLAVCSCRPRTILASTILDTPTASSPSRAGPHRYQSHRLGAWNGAADQALAARERVGHDATPPMTSRTSASSATSSHARRRRARVVPGEQHPARTASGAVARGKRSFR
jgi:hypothetical protein